jgi:hypothetical protein
VIVQAINAYVKETQRLLLSPISFISFLLFIGKKFPGLLFGEYFSSAFLKKYLKEFVQRGK